jgi:hypothetical protein
MFRINSTTLAVYCTLASTAIYILKQAHQADLWLDQHVFQPLLQRFFGPKVVADSGVNVITITQGDEELAGIGGLPIIGDMPSPGRSPFQRRTYGSLMPPRRSDEGRRGLRLGGSAASSVVAHSPVVGGIVLGGSVFGG